MAGRKSKFNDEIVTELCAARENGLPVQTCAEYVGIGSATLYRWLEKGKKAKSGKYFEFYKKWKKAESHFILYHLKKINDSKDWKASQYLLSVTRPDEFNVHNWHNIKAEVKGELDVKQTNVPAAEEIEEIINELSTEYDEYFEGKNNQE